MRKTLFVLIAVLSAVALISSPACAAPVTTGGLTFTELTADLVFTNASGTGTAADPIRLYENVYGLDVTMSIEGMKDIGDPSGGPFVSGFYITKYVTNLTGQTWTYYDLELQEILGVASSEGDGLSFAQGWSAVRPWTSDAFADVDEVTDVRDYVNFSNGSVAPGETVWFSFIITDNSPIDTFFLRQRPNYQPGEAPEPATILLLGFGLLGLVGLRRR